MECNNLKVLMVFVIFYTEFTFSKMFKIRNTRQGRVQGYIQNIEGVGQVERYFGIPYAAPPIGHLRFEDPVDAQSWGNDVYNSTVLSPACLQMKSNFAYIHAHYFKFDRHNEDCLYLNIYVPVQKKNELIEVLVHIHGGSNEHGMGALLHGDVLAIKAGVVFISFNYRLGALGFLSANSSDFPGNYGIKDQVKALQWVQNNIHYFGGDKNKVTITGHSAGACDVGLHIISPMSQGLFRYGIMESGSPLAYWCVDTDSDFIMERFNIFTKKNSCNQKDIFATKECLKELDYKVILDYAYITMYNRFIPFGIVVDNDFMPKIPEIMFKEGNLNGDAYMTGLTHLEGSWAVSSYTVENKLLDDEIKQSLLHIDVINKNEDITIALLKEAYFATIDKSNLTQRYVALANMIGDPVFVAPAVLLADLLASRQAEIYFYSFDHISEDDRRPLHVGVPHGDDLFYLFGSPFTVHFHQHYTEEDQVISEAFINMYSSFIKTGKPTIRSSNIKTLPKYEISTKHFFRLLSNHGHIKIKLDENMRPKKVMFWNEFMPLLNTILNKDFRNCGAKLSIYSAVFSVVLLIHVM